MKKEIENIVRSLDGQELPNKGNGWINLAKIGKTLRAKGVRIQGKLMAFFELMPEEYELYEDFTGMVKVIYVRPRKKDVNPSCESSPIRTQPIVTEHNSVNKDKIQNWAYLYDINDFLEKLANMALPEDWKFGNGLPPYPNYPILWSYIKLTFCRLQRQNKVAYSIDSEYAAFNTGLVDYRYMPIIALFKRNFPSKKSQWVFYDFVISGEGNGKKLNQVFTEDVAAPTYTDNPSELIYDVNLGVPYIDYEHIIIERVDRLPNELLLQCGLGNNIVKDVSNLSKDLQTAYFDELRREIQNNSIVYRILVNRMMSAISLAIKKVSWNYKNAVPMYFPKENRVCLLLPLCLVNDKKEDVALVVKKTPANKYEGATIIPLDWAYADARVVARPNSEWLDIKNNKIEGNKEL